MWTAAGARVVMAELRRFARWIRHAGFDVAIDLQGLVKSGLLTAATRAPLRIGFARTHCREPWNALFTNRHVTPPPAAVHVVEQYLSLLTPLGITERHPVFHLPGRREAEQTIECFLAEHEVKPQDRLVAVNPGAGRADKRWPVAHFRRLAQRLADEAACRVLILWGPAEQGLVSAIGEGLIPPPMSAPPTNLHELAALFRRVSLVVAGDTGPLHLAAALGTPALGLYGPTRAERNGPYGARCRALQSPDGTMAALTPDRVFRVAAELLDENSGGFR